MYQEEAGCYRGKEGGGSIGAPAGSQVGASSDPKARLVEEKVIELEVATDGRLYLDLTIYGKQFYGFLDSGATHTIIGEKAWPRLEAMGLKLLKSGHKSVRQGRSGDCPVTGRIDAVIRVNGVEKVVSILVSPTLPHGLVLGISFWRLFGLLPDALKGTCLVRDGSNTYECPVYEENNVPVLDDMVVVPKDRLSEDERRDLDAIVDRYQNTLGKPGLGCTDRVCHSIDTGTARPVRQRYYSYSPKLLEVLHKGLDEWLELGVVEPSCSPWASAVILVKKRDGSYRWVVDLRKVNEVTRADSYPLPKVNDILDQLRDARYISSIDLKSAYFQIPLDEASKEKTAFIVPGRGLFQFRRMPQGLHTSAATWQRFIDQVLGEDLKPYVFVYLDDIIIVSPDFKQHAALLEKVLARLEAAKLTINFEKSQFCREELRYLGYVVDKDGLHVDPEKVEAIAGFQRPDNRKGLSQFIGMASWYRRFVPGFSSIMAPLHALTSRQRKFIWTRECEEAFLLVKEKLMTAPVLACPDFSKEFVLHCDASGVGLGAILTQDDKVIAYASRSLTACERKYFPTELECLAVLWAIEKFRCYLEGYKFTVVTDHASLVWLNNLKDPCGRLGRWAVRLQQFDYRIVHRKGKEHEAPDALSRNPLPYDGVSVDLMEVVDASEDAWYNKQIERVLADPDSYPSWKVEGQQLLKLVSHGLGPAQWNRVVPKERRAEVLQECHDSPLAGHYGVNKTWHKIRQTYYWPRMRKDIRVHVASCETCLQYKVPQEKPAGLMGGARKISAPFQFLSTDLMGPFPRSYAGYTYLIVTTCLFSKYVWLRPLRNAKAANVCKHLEEDVFLKYAVPGTLLTDNGKQFNCDEVRQLCDKYGVKLMHSFFYHAQANPTERVNRVVKTMMAAYVKDNHRNWDKNLNYIATAVNSVRHDVTGYSPHELVFGDKWRDSGKWKYAEMAGQELPPFGGRQGNSDKRAAVYAEVVERLKKAYERNAHYYNLRRRAVECQIGQTVYREDHTQSDKSKFVAAKLAPKYLGPFKVVKKVGYMAYLLEGPDGKTDGPWHIEALKLPKDVGEVAE